MQIFAEHLIKEMFSIFQVISVVFLPLHNLEGALLFSGFSFMITLKSVAIFEKCYLAGYFRRGFGRGEHSAEEQITDFSEN